MNRRRTHERAEASPLEIAAFIGLCLFASVVLAGGAVAFIIGVTA